MANLLAFSIGKHMLNLADNFFNNNYNYITIQTLHVAKLSKKYFYNSTIILEKLF